MLDLEYKLSVSNNATYIIINLLKPMTVELGQRCGSEATALGKSTGINRYLFDLRGAPNIENVLPNYHFAYQGLESFGFPRTSQTALLTDADDKSHDFMETLFLNAGYKVLLFRDEAAAVAWLER
jgi:hypothetical protein